MAEVRDYISIARPDHWIKNIFVLPGVISGLLFLRRFHSQLFLLTPALIASILAASATIRLMNIWTDYQTKFILEKI